MAGKPRPQEVLIEAIRLVEQYGSVDRAASETGVPRTTLQYRYREAIAAAQRGEFGRNVVIPGFEMTRVSSTLDAAGHVVAEHVQQRPERLETFDVPDGHRVKGISALVDSTGRVVNQWVKTTNAGLSPEMVVDAVKEALDGYQSPIPAIGTPKRALSDLVSVYPLVDWHIGLLAWSRETGEDYDLKIARSAILAKMDACIAATEPAEALLFDLA